MNFYLTPKQAKTAYKFLSRLRLSDFETTKEMYDTFELVKQLNEYLK